MFPYICFCRQDTSILTTMALTPSLISRNEGSLLRVKAWFTVVLLNVQKRGVDQCVSGIDQFINAANSKFRAGIIGISLAHDTTRQYVAQAKRDHSHSKFSAQQEARDVLVQICQINNLLMESDRKLSIHGSMQMSYAQNCTYGLDVGVC